MHTELINAAPAQWAEHVMAAAYANSPCYSFPPSSTFAYKSVSSPFTR